MSWNISKEQKEHIEKIAGKMLEAQLPNQFVEDAISFAIEYEGGYGLMAIWMDEVDQKERNLTVDAICEMVEEHRSWKDANKK